MQLERHDRADAIARRIVERLDGKVVLGLPLGLGKANHIANALYAMAREDRAIDLHISTALTLEPPGGSSELESRFIDPLRERLFSGVTELDYASDLRSGDLPPNVTVSEFFFLAGRWLSVPAAQQAYVSANYTHAAGYMAERGINVIAQMVAARGEGEAQEFSLSSNTDITLDILPLVKAAGDACLLVGEVNANLPFMTGPAALPASAFDMVLDGEGREARLFATPKQPVSDADHAIGLNAAGLVPDGGTLQIGIGSIGDAFTAALLLRQKDPTLFEKGLSRLNGGRLPENAQTGAFETGLYAASEMFVDGFMNLYREGILKRRASDGAVLHSGFFLGTEEFYAFLRELPEEERDLFRMCGISFVNELYGEEDRKRGERVDARFVNNAMMATVLGEAISDGLDDGRIVSGVGGQYNFVAQAFALDGARSVMTLNATRQSKGEAHSRILSRYAHTTIPRHLRDIFVTEYGVADLRGKSDRDCIAAMIAISDSRFQDELVRAAKDAGKLEKGYEIPWDQARNTPERIAEALKPLKDAGQCATFPLGTAFTEEERRLLPALALLKEKTATKSGMATAVLGALASGEPRQEHLPLIRRMGLAKPEGARQRLYRRLLAWALKQKDA
ncbi:MAG: acetyl-CoA hydrolase/transferase C-terminal domain-containing protein [Rhizobiaceae bacterium]